MVTMGIYVDCFRLHLNNDSNDLICIAVSLSLQVFETVEASLESSCFVIIY
jgi:hypothetical protein